MTELLKNHLNNNTLITHLKTFEIKNSIICGDYISYGIPNLYIFNNGSIFFSIEDDIIKVLWYSLYNKINKKYLERMKKIFQNGGNNYNIDYDCNNNSYNIYTNIIINNFENIIEDNNEYNKNKNYKYGFYGFFILFIYKFINL